MRKGTLLLCALLGSVLLAVHASAQTNDNLLVDPSFATDLSGWLYNALSGGASHSGGSEWSNKDVDGSASSGSAEIVEFDDTGGIEVVAQCVALPGPGPYDVGATFYLPSGQSQRPGGGDLVAWFASADCTGDPSRTDEFDTDNPPPLDTWTPVLASSVDPPAGSASALLLFGIFKNDDATDPAPVVGYVDGTSFGPTSVPLGVTTVDLLAGTTGRGYQGFVEPIGGLLPYVVSLTEGSSMPPGLALGADGSVTGTPHESGDFHFGVTVHDAASHQASATIGIQVNPRVKIKTPDGLTPGKVKRGPPTS